MTDAVTKVAADLTAITALADDLLEQAVARACSRDLPGGAAMVAVGPVANQEAWLHKLGNYERRGEYPDLEHEDEQVPPLQTLLFWTEDWRREWGQEIERPTLTSEVGFLRQVLHWAREHELHWDDFADDVKQARRRLEDVLYAGERVERTQVPCIEVECVRRPNLIKVYRASVVEDGYKCPACRAEYDAMRFITAKRDWLHSQGADRHVRMEDARDAIDRPERTWRKWLRMGYVRSYRDGLGRTWVWWPDVREVDVETQRRVVRREAA